MWEIRRRNQDIHIFDTCQCVLEVIITLSVTEGDVGLLELLEHDLQYGQRCPLAVVGVGLFRVGDGHFITHK